MQRLSIIVSAIGLLATSALAQADSTNAPELLTALSGQYIHTMPIGEQTFTRGTAGTRSQLQRMCDSDNYSCAMSYAKKTFKRNNVQYYKISAYSYRLERGVTLHH